MVSEYLHKKAEVWVSHVVLVGCILITAGLFYISYQADAIGTHYSEKANHDSIELLLNDIK